jgi:hypothetical protein
MKISSRLKAAFAFVCSLSSLSATPLLFVNYNLAMTQFAQTRAGALGLEYDTVADFTSVSDLRGRSVIIMPGFSNHNNLLHQANILRDFVQAGGYLWINVAGGGCANHIAPGGVDFLQYSCGGSYNQSESLVNPAHAYVEGTFNPKAKALTEADFMNWNVTDLGHLSGLPSNATAIARNPNGPTLAEYAYGQGWVVVSTLTYGWGDNGAKGAPANNMLLYAADQVRGSETPVEADTPEPASLLFTAGGLLFGISLIRRRETRRG